MIYLSSLEGVIFTYFKDKYKFNIWKKKNDKNEEKRDMMHEFHNAVANPWHMQ